MKLLEILTYPDTRLRQPSVELKDFNDEIKEFINDLINTMYVEDGIGLAAIQVGRPEKIFVIDGNVADSIDPIVFINPKILETSNNFISSNEGCLSFPGIYVDIKRPDWVKMEAINQDGKLFITEGEGLLARVLQHEFDHLSGKLLIDLVGLVKREQIKKKTRNKK